MCVCVCVCVYVCVCVCVRARVALVIQKVIRMRHSIICGLSNSTIFSTLSQKRQDFRRKIIEHKMCAVLFCTPFI
jgi:hypothetical protein